jgi:hypothetical protein
MIEVDDPKLTADLEDQVKQWANILGAAGAE